VGLAWAISTVLPPADPSPLALASRNETERSDFCDLANMVWPNDCWSTLKETQMQNSKLEVRSLAPPKKASPIPGTRLSQPYSSCWYRWAPRCPQSRAKLRNIGCSLSARWHVGPQAPETNRCQHRQLFFWLTCIRPATHGALTSERMMDRITIITSHAQSCSHSNT